MQVRETASHSVREKSFFKVAYLSGCAFIPGRTFLLYAQKLARLPAPFINAMTWRKLEQQIAGRRDKSRYHRVSLDTMGMYLYRIRHAGCRPAINFQRGINRGPLSSQPRYFAARSSPPLPPPPEFAVASASRSFADEIFHSLQFLSSDIKIMQTAKYLINHRIRLNAICVRIGI